MTPEELVKIESKYNVAIIAPAGHGKTEMVADMVAGFSGKQLVLTHTNAGVDAIQKPVSYTHLDVYKRQRLFKRTLFSLRNCPITIMSVMLTCQITFIFGFGNA